MSLTLKSLTAIVLSVSCLFADEEGFSPLFNGETLEGWTAARSKKEGDSGAFSVNKDEKAIQTYTGREANSKQGTDCLVSDKEFSHFILKLEYKWLEKRFAPRPDWDRDAGLLFHVHGNTKKVWPLALEMQMGESAPDKPFSRGSAGRFHTGDLYVLGKKLQTETPAVEGYYAKEGEITHDKMVLTKLGKEKPKGEWNEMEIRVQGGKKATFLLNGEVVLETSNFTQVNKDGKTVPLDKGRIGLQAEWAELLYRNIRIKELPSGE